MQWPAHPPLVGGGGVSKEAAGKLPPTPCIADVQEVI